jgi:hypothetical protein
MKTYEVSGYYGSGNTPCTVYVAESHHGNYYAVDGSLNVNLTEVDIKDGVNVELLPDHDMFTAGNPITSVEDLIEAIES